MSLHKDSKVRLGCHDFLNALPLIHPLLDNRIGHNFDLILDSPGRIAELMREGKLDIAMIPSIEYLRHDHYLLFPELAIASLGKVDSVLLFSQRPISELRKIAVDSRSRTSVAMLKIIFAERYGCEPQLIPMQADPCQMLQAAEAALIIGDQALMLQPPTPLVYDLGEEWFCLTRRPFVHAVMVLWPERQLREELRLLKTAQNMGLSSLTSIAEEGARRTGLDYQVCLRYLREKIIYSIGPAELEGLRHFAKLAAKYGLIDHPEVSIRLFGQ